MRSYVLRFSIAVLTFVVGIIATTVFYSRHVPPPSAPAQITSEAAETQPDSIATPVTHERNYISRRVVGYVKDRENHPVAGAEVRANPYGPVAGVIPHGVSKVDGSFTLDIWWPDKYFISAEHLAKGYPDVTNSFYGSFFGVAPAITVSESNELRPVEVRVGPIAGRVSLQIVDDQSGRPVTSGLLKVCRTDDPKVCMKIGTAFPHGRYDLLAPEVPFTIKFEVRGKDWDAVDQDGVPVEMLGVDLGVREEVKIRLRRVDSKVM